ncbi:aminotransferase [uncultured Cohaesibacter sp.]|uniref:SIS domain-containing protein n=1 Tax=uncultured Cohaesibacter sp. TaxID=1002546 RepID=UPI0029C7EEDE|nr:aminotransferase [uncultured Cohaesibacter sp.]
MNKKPETEAQLAIYDEMARQLNDSRASIEGAGEAAEKIAASLRQTGRLLLLGMGGSHAVGRALEPLYRASGIDAIALPLSEQLGQPLPLAGRTIIVTSQSGESAEVLRWFRDCAPKDHVFGLTMEPNSSLAGLAPCLVGAGGSEIPFAATRSLTVSAALHAAVLGALGQDLGDLFAILEGAGVARIDEAVAALAKVHTVVTSSRQLQGVAEAIALGLTELSRLPCFSLEGGQLRHGPVEMLGETVGVVLFRAADETCDLVTGLAEFVAETPSPLVIFDASGKEPIKGAISVPCHPAKGLAAIFSLLPAAQRFMVDFAASRVDNVGTPLRCTKVTRVE